jgi:hypothetical protein
MKTVSIGIKRDDGDLSILATFNNNDEYLSDKHFDCLINDVLSYMNEKITDVVQAIERQDAPDYVELT